MQPLLKILHLEDNQADAFLIQRELKKAGFNFQLEVLESREQFIEALETFKPDLILSDHSMPQFNSMEALEIYKSLDLQIPFILVTGSVSEEFAITSIKQGADDYILKSNIIRLPSAINQALNSRQVKAEKQKSDDELESLNKELSTFIYKAAHDLRGPLCSVMGLINVASTESDPNILPQYIEKIAQGTNKLDLILLSLMEIMSIKTMTPVITEVNFETLVEMILERLKFTDGFSEVKCSKQIPMIKGVFSDENILNAVLVNIVENAIKFRNTAAPECLVYISASQTPDGVEIKVEDNGMGMSEEVQDKIFDMYYKGNQFSKSAGLGLYVAANGIKKLGGSIHVNSSIAQGSVFTIKIPAQAILMQ